MLIASLFENMIFQRTDREKLLKIEIILISYYMNGDFIHNSEPDNKWLVSVM